MTLSSKPAPENTAQALQHNPNMQACMCHLSFMHVTWSSASRRLLYAFGGTAGPAPRLQQAPAPADDPTGFSLTTTELEQLGRQDQWPAPHCYSLKWASRKRLLLCCSPALGNAVSSSLTACSNRVCMGDDGRTGGFLPN